MAKSNSVRATVEPRREHWRRVVRRWEASGLPQAEFCRRHDIPAWKLAWWRKRLAEDTGPAGDRVGAGREAARASQKAAAVEPKAWPAFVPVTMAPAAATAAELELSLAGGRILRFGAGVDPARLSAIVAALEGLPVVAANSVAESSPC